MTIRQNNSAERKNDFYFWLGADGEAKPVTETEFEKRQQIERERQRRLREAGIDVVG